MNQIDKVGEAVSALADGDLRGDDFARVVESICADAEVRATWQTYHVVGDVLRSGGHAPCSDGDAFLARFQQRLAAEPAIQRPREIVLPLQRPVEAANEPVFRWKLVAGAASLAAAAAIGWTWIGGGAQLTGPQLAQQQPAPSVLAASGAPALSDSARLVSARVVVGNSQPQVMLRDPRLDQLLEAHRQAGGAAQMPSSFLRNATFEGASR